MVGFLKKVFGGDGSRLSNGKAHTGAKSDVPVQSFKVDRLAELIRYFPLGEKVQYYPEYMQSSALETIVLGYSVNDHFIFSPLNIRHQDDNGQEVLRLMVDGHEQLVSDIKQFRILIPYNEDDENKRDYTRRAELGPRGAFRRSNTITLVSCTSGGTLSTMDTLVHKIHPLDSGIYGGHKVVLLDAMPDSLKLTDQRQHYRLPTRLPARLAIKDAGVYACTLMDFSEESVQLKFERTNYDLDTLTEYRRLTLTVDASFDSNSKVFVLDGVMFRKTDSCMVMKLQGIYKNKELKPFNLVDILDIKANLLRHPETQKALGEERTI